MASRKNRPLLWEVVAKSRARDTGAKRTDVPVEPADRVAPGGTSGSGAASGELSRERTVALPTARGPADDAAGAAAAPLDGQRSMRWIDGRVELALGWQELLVAAVLLVSIAAGFFYAGVQSGKASVRPAAVPDPGPSFTLPPNPAGAGTAPPTPEDAGPGSSGISVPAREPEPPPVTPAPAPEPQPARFEPRKGYEYVTIQYFSRNATGRASAQQALSFMQQRGVPCALLDRRADLRLVATEPFDVASADKRNAERDRAEALRRRIVELGKEFNMVGGYSFAGAKLE